MKEPLHAQVTILGGPNMDLDTVPEDDAGFYYVWSEGGKTGTKNQFYAVFGPNEKNSEDPIMDSKYAVALFDKHVEMETKKHPGGEDGVYVWYPDGRDDFIRFIEKIKAQEEKAAKLAKKDNTVAEAPEAQ